MSASGTTRKRGFGIDAATRAQLVSRARHARTRDARFTIQRPTDWCPTEVRNPDGGRDGYFTHSTAWEFIASRLEAGEDVEIIELEKPKGSKGYVMKISLGPGSPELYVKLQMGPTKVYGRSFHYSKLT